MRRAGTDKLKTPTNTLFIRQSDAVVLSDDVADVYRTITVKMPARTWHAILGVCASFAPAELCTLIEAVRPTEDISLSAIKKAIKSGVTVDGADVEFHDSLVLR
jgi:hypothetical protein